MKWLDLLTSALAESPLLARLASASLELLVLTTVLASLLRCWRPSSPRLVAFLWLIVLVKPAVSLVVGAPIAIVRLELPAEDPRQAVPVVAFQHRPVVPEAAQADPAGFAGDSTRSTGLSLSSMETGRPESLHFELRSILFGLWLIGGAIFLGRYLFARWRLRGIVAGSDAVPRSLWRRHEEIASELGLSRAPMLRATESLDSPAVVGVLRPVVLLPGWLVEHGTPSQIDWALRHELSHIRWFDPLAILVRDVSTILFHFHPAVWWAGRRHLEAVELACDQGSLRHPSDAPAYAQGLYEILLQVREHRHRAPGVGILAMAKHGPISRRISALLEGTSRPLTNAGAACAALAGVLVLVFGCAMTRSASPASEPDVSHVPHASQDLSALKPGANLFLLGPVDDFLQVAEAARTGPVGLHNIWGRPHEAGVYRDLFENASNPFDRQPDDLLVLLLTLEPDGRLPEEYEDLLPAPLLERHSRATGARGELRGAARCARNAGPCARGSDAS